MIEIWKATSTPHYEVSNMGNVRSLLRFVERSGEPMLITPKLLKHTVVKDRYRYDEFVRKGGTVIVNFGRKTYDLHRVVAQTFVPNPNNFRWVKFKNGNRLDCRAENLEWTAYCGRGREKRKAVGQYSNGELVATYEGVRATERDGFMSASVSRCANGKCIHHKGFQWKYLNNN